MTISQRSHSGNQTGVKDIIQSNTNPYHVTNGTPQQCLSA